MKRVKCVVAYDGTAFHGYQVQPNKRTVQSEIEQALRDIHKGNDVRITASGRTDAGVHAMGQVFHFDTNLSIPIEKWPTVLNSKLTDEISIQSAEFTDPDFHARFAVKKKEYRYRIQLDNVKDPFLRNYAWHYPHELDLGAIQEAASLLIGKHDFTSFCSAKTEVEDKVREIYDIQLTKSGSTLFITFNGNGFLYNMVRIIVGTLIDIGNGRYQPSDVENMLKRKNRSAAGKTAPAHGLYLWKVDY